MAVMTGQELREKRRKRGWTQIKLADKVGVRQGTIAKWESNPKIDKRWRQKINCIFNLAPEPKVVVKTEIEREIERLKRVEMLHKLDRKTGGKWALLAEDDEDLIEYRKMVGAK